MFNGACCDSAFWSYTIPCYIAAVHKCHPNDVAWLINHQTFQVRDVGAVISRIPQESRMIFDPAYIVALYSHYQSHQIEDADVLVRLRQKWDGKEILVVAPG